MAFNFIQLSTVPHAGRHKVAFVGSKSDWSLNGAIRTNVFKSRFYQNKICFNVVFISRRLSNYGAVACVIKPKTNNTCRRNILYKIAKCHWCLLH